MQLDLTFRNDEQEKFFWHRERNGEFDGAFNNGKSYVGSQRAATHLMLFPNYGMSICRQTYVNLRKTTMKTFFKVVPDKFVHRHNEQEGITVLKNGSFIYWMHLDAVDEASLRGLEINSALIDQAEEVKEPIYLVLDARVGRWDKAEVPMSLLYQELTGENKQEYQKHLKDKTLDEPGLLKWIQDKTLWPRHPKWGNFLVNNYMDVLCNLSDDDDHWTYRFYNKDSNERQDDHFYITRESDKDLTDIRTYNRALTRDKEWVDKYIRGIRVESKAKIHPPIADCIIQPDDYEEDAWNDFINRFFESASLVRILDHADTGTTAVGWAGIYNKSHIFYREYTDENKLISFYRNIIVDLSGKEKYDDEIADPSIWKKNRQIIDGQQSGFYCVADEYVNDEVSDAPQIYWQPADNNELATRNRINELILPQDKYYHPITKISPAPGIYFIETSKNTNRWDMGCDLMITQVRKQRKLLLGENNGKKIYSMERDADVVDHCYDLVRYFVAKHNTDRRRVTSGNVSKNSFAYYNKISQMRRESFGPMSEG